jgi:multidrug efflux system membrane fusion protein
MNRRRGLKWAGALLAMLLAGLVGWRALSSRSASKRPASPPKVPVTLAAVSREDVPIWLEGLGTVVPLATVLVKSRVDGELTSVNFEEGRVLRKGELLAQVDPRPFQIAVAQASGTLRRDLATAENNRLNLERLRGLLDEKLIAPQQVDNQRALVGQDQGTLAVDRAQLANARLQLEWSRIVSPIDGVAGIRQVDVGNLVRAADANGLVVLTQLDPISVVFTLPQDALTQISSGMARGPLRVEAFARDGSTALGTGTLQAIDNQINQTTATVRLKAQLANPEHLLWPNAFVKARLQVEVRKDAWVIPTVAVQRGPNGPFVYLAHAGTAALRPVQIDITQGPRTLVKSGLGEGDEVVVEGQNQLRPGAPIEPRPTSNPDGGGRPSALGLR